MSAESKPVPPIIKTAPPLALLAGIMLVVTALGAGAVLFFFNPSSNGFYPICLFHRMTGLNCPGCGGTRSAYALLHGHFALAFKDNALFVILLVAAAGRGAWFGMMKMLRRPAGQFFPAKLLWLLLVIAAVFTVLRNLPVFGFLSP